MVVGAGPVVDSNGSSNSINICTSFLGSKKMRIELDIVLFSFWWTDWAKWIQLVEITNHSLFYIGYYPNHEDKWEFEFLFHKAILKGE
jgi:hypothetical protein